MCEICNSKTEFIKKHHIHSKSLGGNDSPSNKAYICSDCHDMVHAGLIIIEGRFNSMNGNILVWRRFTEPSITELSDPKCWLKPNSKKLQEKYLNRIKINE